MTFDPAHRVVLSSGWERAVITFVAGACGALAMPPIGFWPALIPSLVVAVWLLDGVPPSSTVLPLSSSLRAAALGWLWGLGYFTAGLWWIGAAFLVEADVFAWLMPFGVLGLPAVLALFCAFGFALARLLWSSGPWRILALTFGLSVSEYLRAYALTGFPWNNLGLAFGQSLPLMQAASSVGMFGLTALVVAILASPATLLTGGRPAERFAAPILGLVALLALLGSGLLRLSHEGPGQVAGVKLRILQPNLQQDQKFRSDRGGEILDGYLALSDRTTSPTQRGLKDVTHLIWPESAFPFLLHREPNALARIADKLGQHTVLITGAAREAEGLPGETGRRFYNAIQVVAPGGAIVATYDKVHLVPFGEYVPGVFDRALRAIGLRQFVHIPGGFSAGERHTVLKAPGLPDITASVCYEAIFPAEAEAPPRSRPGLILNVTNDGWFGLTAGPYQHFAQARLRAVEQGLPLVRSANTGISGVVDPYGRVVASLGLGLAGTVDSPLPAPLPSTIYRRYGEAFPAGLYTIALLGAIAGRWRSRRRSPFATAARSEDRP